MTLIAQLAKKFHILKTGPQSPLSFSQDRLTVRYLEPIN